MGRSCDWIFFSRVFCLFVCFLWWFLSGVHSLPRVTAVARKRPRLFSGWQVTVKLMRWPHPGLTRQSGSELTMQTLSRGSRILNSFYRCHFWLRHRSLQNCQLADTRVLYDILGTVTVDHKFGSPWAHLHVVGMLRFMSEIHQPRLPTPYSVHVSISVIKAHSTVFHSINSPDNSLLSHSVLRSYLCLIGLFNYISLYESLPQPWYNSLRLTGLKAQAN